MSATMETKAIELIKESKKIVFLTGAGVSVPSGIPDYRSLEGVYAEIEAPEYLLSRTCLKEEPEKFYRFVKKLYHPTAEPNIIHQTMALFESVKKDVSVITQNIDQLHQKAGSRQVTNFHGNLYHVYCSRCGESVAVTNYLSSDKHADCGGQLRPDVVLYEEGIKEKNIEEAIEKISQADTIVIVGTSLKVYPFASLLQYKSATSFLIVINKEKLNVADKTISILGDASDFFNSLCKEL